MSKEIIRQALVTGFVTALGSYPTLPSGFEVEYDNRDLADATKQLMYGRLSILIPESEQASLEPKAIVRHWGQLLFKVYTPVGQGVAKANDIVSHVAANMQLRAYGPVRVRAGAYSQDAKESGMWMTPLILPFWADIYTS